MFAFRLRKFTRSVLARSGSDLGNKVDPWIEQSGKI